MDRNPSSERFICKVFFQVLLVMQKILLNILKSPAFSRVVVKNKV